MDNKSKGFSIAGLVLGICACALAWEGIITGIIAIACGIVGLILSLKANKMNPTKLSKAALILSIIGLALAIVGTIACGICTCASAAALSNPDVQSELESAISGAIN